MSKELKLLKKHFEKHCTVKLYGTTEEKDYFHWKRLIFRGDLNSEELIEIGQYVINYFSETGRYSHLLPKLVVHNGQMCLTFDKGEINKFLDN
jgi:hypothetical protein